MRAHLHSGDVSATAATEAGIEGEHLVFREALIDGPAPAGVSDEEWVELRARHLSETYGEDLVEMREVSEEELSTVDGLLEAEEIHLWFDRDLFCQVNLMFVLARLTESGFGGSCTIVESHTGDAGSLEHSIRHLTPEAIDGYARAWYAYGAEDPGALDQVIRSELPDSVRRAIELHRERFPSCKNGLGRPERSILEIIAGEGPITFEDLFVRFASTEGAYGLGDAQVWARLLHLASETHPLIEIDEAGDPIEATLRSTALGREILAGETDAIELRGIDQWLGGAHLTDGNIWRYDEGDLVEECPGS